MKTNRPGLRSGRRGLLLALFLIPIACGSGGGDPSATPKLRHPIASAADGVAGQFEALSSEDSALLEGFRKTATPALGSTEVRRVCAALGRALATADPEVVADFVLTTRDHLYAEFFASFDAGALERLADALRVTGETPELTVLQIEFILRQAHGAYSGTLVTAAAEVSFLDAMAPRPMPISWLTPAEDAPREIWLGAAAALRSPSCVQGGARMDLALDVSRRALARWPGDPVLVSGMATLLIENEEREPMRAMEFLEVAGRQDSGNAAWLYLQAARHFRAGQDGRALGSLSAAAERPHLSFHEVERARWTSKFLTALGYSPIRARVVALRITSNAAALDLKLAGSKALLRSYEHDDLESCRVLLELPLVIERQLGDGPRLLLTEQVVLSLLCSGLPRLANLDPGGPDAIHTDAAARARKRLEAIEAGERLCGGLRAWGKVLAHGQDAVLLRLLDEVLSGGEARFLASCAGADNLTECLSRFR